MTHISGDQGHYPQRTKKIKKKEKKSIGQILKETAGVFAGRLGKGPDKAVDRASQFRMYMDTIDKLKSARADLPGRIPLGNLEAKSGKIGSARTTRMTDILDKYHDKALRMAQAKYYQKQLG